MKIFMAFPEGKHKALTMSYDDGKKPDLRLVEIFNRYGIKGTFHLNSGLLDDGIRLPSDDWGIYKGHEMACHTVTHPTYIRCPKEEIITEIMDDRKYIENIAKHPVHGLSYPNGSFNSDIASLLPSLGIKYSRTTTSTHQFDVPDNFLMWNPTCHHNEDIMGLGKEFLSFTKKQYFYIMYVWGHSYEFDRDNNWDRIENFCELMSGKEDIWYATNIEIVECFENFKRLDFTVDLSYVTNPTSSDIWIIVNSKHTVKIPSGATMCLKEYDN